MKFAFTELIRSLEPNEQHPAGFEAAWKKLRNALIGELRKRSLWDAPPSYLGTCGWTHWSDHGALEELMVDCFTSVFIDRLAALKALLETMENVEGLVFRNIRNFLHDTQKKNNPLGFRVFVVLRAAIRRAIATERLYVLDGDPGISNATVLGFVPWSDPGRMSGDAELKSHVRTWSDDLMPELVTARPAELEKLEETLCTYIVRLGAESIEAFRFKDIVDALKSDVRARWAAIWRSEDGETALEAEEGELVRVVRLAHPDSSFEERQFFEALLDCVDTAIEGLDKYRPTRDHLHKLWGFLGRHAAEVPEGEPADVTTVLPSGRKLAESLDIPRHRLPELFEILGSLVQRCRTAERQPVR